VFFGPETAVVAQVFYYIVYKYQSMNNSPVIGVNLT
jgi:hypothetical protein